MNELTLICGYCGNAIDPGTGCLGVSNAAVSGYLRDMHEWQEAHGGQLVDLATLLAMRDEIPWSADHYSCAGTQADGGDDRYEINSRQLYTWRHLTSWTAHLMGKNWLEATDWDDLLREVADGTSTRIRAAVASAA